MKFSDHILHRMRRFGDIENYDDLPNVVVLDASGPVEHFVGEMEALENTQSLERPMDELLNEALMYLADEKQYEASVIQFANDIADLHFGVNGSCRLEEVRVLATQFITAVHQCIVAQAGYTKEGLFPYEVKNWIEYHTPVLVKLNERTLG